MIRPPARSGVAFSEKSDGDLRADMTARTSVSNLLGISGEWAGVAQVHGNEVVRVAAPGSAGEADALWTTEPGLPLAVFTADCFGVVLHADGAVGVAHAGWRGAETGVVSRLRDQMSSAGRQPVLAEVGPGIGPCCFEVGPEVASLFGGKVSETTWGTRSVDLPMAIDEQLNGLYVWRSPGCTQHEDGWFSHRRDGTRSRLAAIGWLP